MFCKNTAPSHAYFMWAFGVSVKVIVMQCCSWFSRYFFFYATVMVNNDVHYMLYGQSASYAEGLQIEFMIHNATQD